MNENSFWQMISEARPSRRVDDSFHEEFIQNLQAQLGLLPADEVLSFRDHFRGFFRRIARADVRDVLCILTGLGTANSFEDGVAWLISEGKDVYYGALDDPESIAEFTQGGRNFPCFEGFVCLDIDGAYESKADLPIPPVSAVTAPVEVTGDPCSTREEFATRYPTAWKFRDRSWG